MKDTVRIGSRRPARGPRPQSLHLEVNAARKLPGGAKRAMQWMVVALALACTRCKAMDPMFVRTFPTAGGLTFTLHDDIGSPIYAWPRTLLTYPVDFSARHIRAGELHVTQEQGAVIAFQLSEIRTRKDGTLQFAKVSFFSSLEPGTTHIFHLDGGGGSPTPSHAIIVSQSAADRIVDMGTLKVKLPVSQVITGTADAPGPLLALNRGQGWIGSSRLLSHGPRVTRIEAAALESGALFDIYRVTYIFAGGATYEATVKSVLGYPFVELSETMKGLEPKDGVAVEVDWTGFNPTKRFAANGFIQPPDGEPMDKPLHTPGIIEEPHWYPASAVEDPAREMLFHLAAFEGNAPKLDVPAMDFWEDAAGGSELSVFVPDTKTWDDHQYVVWEPSTRLQVSFRYAAGHLTWHWPIVSGTRTTGISLSDTKNGEAVTQGVRETYENAARESRTKFNQNTNYPGTLNQRYGQWLRSWYGGLSLDKVKDWSLSYPASLKPPVAAFQPDPANARPEDLEKLVYTSSLMTYPLGLDLGAMNISHRIVRPIVESYLQVRPHMPEPLRVKIDAVLLLSAYVNAGEDMAPVRVCITGTPNMSADGFSVPAELSVLYPEHPMAKEWAEQFEKTIQLQAQFYTRPDVPAYQSLGGRWTESLAIYNWAYFAPTLAAQISLTNADGKNRLANDLMAMRGRWMVDELSAPIWNPNPLWRVGQPTQKPKTESPWKSGIALTTENGFERQYTPHGAHGSGSGGAVPKDVPIVAHYLRNFDPLTAEHLLWAYAHRTSTFQGEGDEPFWQKATLDQERGNGGTNPHLRSVKYTGHGIILRAGVDTSEELSVHLDQVDQGPNYRWGDNGESSSGVLYFYANGQPWSGHEQENTGDHSNDDATGTTTFAVLHDHTWRSIGENVLDGPMFDLDIAQYGEIDARQDHDPYSWPNYRSRSVMLVGTDYMLLGDDADGETRFTWFTAKDLPFPKIAFLTPLTSRPDHWSEVTTRMSKGFLRDGIGASVVLVTHKKDEVELEHMKATPLQFPDGVGLSQYGWERGYDPVKTPGVYYVRTATSHDRAFRSFQPIHYRQADEEFAGMAGVIRTHNDGTTNLALLEGTMIAAKGVRIQLPDQARTAISATIGASGNLAGTYQSELATPVSIEISSGAALVCYIDGDRMTMSRLNDTVTFTLPAGRHGWELTRQPPKPPVPHILRTETGKGTAKIYFGKVPAANRYQLEMSTDNAATWTIAATATAGPFLLNNLSAGGKVHVRVAAISGDGSSVPGPEYPVYGSVTVPPAPDGLALELAPELVHAKWGEILGASEYRLYRRTAGQTNWALVYKGLDRVFDDHARGVTPPAYLPGRADNALDNKPEPIYEYAVAAVDGNGESAKSFIISTDPTGWLTWWPRGVERRFKRETGYWLPPNVPATMTPPLHYPERK